VPSIEATARALVDDLAHARFDAAEARFDADLAQAIPEPALASLWRGLEEASGAFQGVEGAETTVESGFRVVRVTCRFARLRKILRVVFGASAAVGGLFYGPVPADLEGVARGLVEKLSKGDFAGAVLGFDAIMKATLPEDKLRVTWARVVKKHGAFTGVEGASFAAANGLWTVILTCRFGAGPLAVKVTYDLRDEVAGLFFLPADAIAPWRPPPYAAPDRFVERDVTVGTSPALPGTITLPKGPGPFPAVVLVHGSGPSDADETVGPNKVFRDLAFGLASRQIAVIRYVKRSRAAPDTVATVRDEVLDGARDAIDRVAHEREVDAKRVVVVGHSQGGYLAPRIAADNPSIAGIVLLAAPSRPLQDSIVDQLTYFLTLDPGGAESKRLVAAAQVFKARVEDPALKPDERVEVPGGGVEKGAYFLSLRGYDPVRVAAQLSIPILVLQGDRDYQVTAADFDGWKKALSGRPGVALTKLPSLNHLFLRGSGTPRPGEYEVPGHVDPAVIEAITAFVGKLPAVP
jgi:dienelactone hydrolase